MLVLRRGSCGIDWGAPSSVPAFFLLLLLLLQKESCNARTTVDRHSQEAAKGHTLGPGDYMRGSLIRWVEFTVCIGVCMYLYIFVESGRGVLRVVRESWQKVTGQYDMIKTHFPLTHGMENDCFSSASTSRSTYYMYCVGTREVFHRCFFHDNLGAYRTKSFREYFVTHYKKEEL